MSDNTKKGYCTVDSVVMEVIADREEGGTHNYDTYLNYGLRGAQEWHFDSAQEVKTVKLEMNGYNAVDWPDDYVDWVKIGIQVGDRVKTYGINDESISLNHDETDECGNPKLNTIADCNSLPSNCNDLGGYLFSNYVSSNGSHLGKLFGIGGGGNCLGYWKYNREKKQFQFESSVIKTNVYLEYISTGFNPCSETVINAYARNMLRTYIHWQKAIFQYGINSGEARGWEEQFDAAQRIARARIFDLSVQDILEFSRKHYKMSIKN